MASNETEQNFKYNKTVYIDGMAGQT